MKEAPLDYWHGESVDRSTNWLDEEAATPGVRVWIGEDSVESIRSFWTCVAGLAVGAIAALPFFASLYLSFDWAVGQLVPPEPSTFSSWIGSEGYRIFQITSSSLFILFRQLVVAAVLISAIPIALWRGSLSRRFFIICSLMLGVSLVLSNFDWQFGVQRTLVNLLPLVIQMACWLSLPIIMQLPVFRELRWLRLLVSTGIFLLSMSVSIASIWNQYLLELSLIECSVGLCVCQAFAIWICNVRGQSLVEAGKEASSIARINSRLIMELTAIVGLFLVLAVPLIIDSQSWNPRVHWLMIGTYAALCLVWICLTFVMLAGNRRSWWYIFQLAILGFATATLFTALAQLSVTFLFVPKPASYWHIWILVGMGLFEFGLLWSYANFCAYWLKRCGWRLDRVPF